MISNEFNQRTLANMEVALERACQSFPARLADHESRKFIAAELIQCALSGKTTLREFTQVARRAAAKLSAAEFAHSPPLSN